MIKTKGKFGKAKATPALEAKPVKEVKVKASKVEVNQEDAVKALQNELVALREQMEADRERTIEEIREANAKRIPDVLEPSKDGVKNPSISSMKVVYTHKQYKELIEHYKTQNPAKFEAKRSALEEKLAKLKG